MRLGKQALYCMILGSYLFTSGCGPEVDTSEITGPRSGDTDTGSTDSGNTDNGNTDNGNTDSGNTDNGNTDDGNTDNGNTDTGSTDDGNNDNSGSESTDPTDPDPRASVSLTGGDIEDCIPGFLSGGGQAAYSGFAGSSYGSYFIWKDAWDGSSINLRIETWDSFGGITDPGTHTITDRDTNYTDCGLCVFAETADGDFWPVPGSTVTFTALKTGSQGIGEMLAGTIDGTFTNGNCSGDAQVSFSGVARNMDHGPL